MNPQDKTPQSSLTAAGASELTKAALAADVIPDRLSPGSKRRLGRSSFSLKRGNMSAVDLIEAINLHDKSQKAQIEEVRKKELPNLENLSPAELREKCRFGTFTRTTVGLCLGYVQANLVVLPKAFAYDFLLLCTRNKQSCPLLHVCDAGSPIPGHLAPTADLRKDLPGYVVYRHGVASERLTDISHLWNEDSVAFLIGCSFSYDGAFQKKKLPNRAASAGRNVPMYRTSVPVRPAGIFDRGTVVVSMKPIPSDRVAEEVRLTSRFPHAHGPPLAVGSGRSIGVEDIYSPDFGEAPLPLEGDDVPIFHACGVTPQSVLMACGENIPIAITHAPGKMFVTDILAEDFEDYIQ
uniref:DUF1445 domain-containing protein n=1 Tax=Corethron hystrix TaxID=216773 RepID=A0A7S1BHG2_9STRA|mmetsp:Transcript_28037/g.64182  ORF Transcript_28037/g.64182 Transcript_28037/m.64182 type:complete len:351 (+) Transcript_28037:356-1408(+)